MELNNNNNNNNNIKIPNLNDYILLNENNQQFNADYILKETYLVKTNFDLGDSFAKAVREANKNSGMIATIPQIIEAKAKSGLDHLVHQNDYVGHTEEILGIDSEGIFTFRNEPIVIVVHGGFSSTETVKYFNQEAELNSKRIFISNDSFKNLLYGNQLPDGTQIELFHLNEIKAGRETSNPHFGVIVPYCLIQGEQAFKNLTKSEYLTNSLVLARNGSSKNLNQYFEKMNVEEIITNSHNHDFHLNQLPQNQSSLIYIKKSGGAMSNTLGGLNLLVIPGNKKED